MPESGGQFEMAAGGQFHLAGGGQFAWIFHDQPTTGIYTYLLKVIKHVTLFFKHRTTKDLTFEVN